MIGRVPEDFTDRVVVVTGASSGIGRGAAVAFAERGAKVVLAARSEGSLEEAAEECRRGGGQALAVPTDVSDEDAVKRLAERSVEHFGGVDVWVNNAAVMAYARFENMPGSVHHAVIETNLMGQIYGSRAVLPYFRQQGSGVLTNVASLYAKMTSPYVSPFVISKFGVLGLSEVLRQERAPQRATRTACARSVRCKLCRASRPRSAGWLGRRAVDRRPAGSGGPGGRCNCRRDGRSGCRPTARDSRDLGVDRAARVAVSTTASCRAR